MIYSAIVKSKIRQSFDHVNNHRWVELMGSIAPNVHHRFLGTHAIEGSATTRRHCGVGLSAWGESSPTSTSRSTTSG
jgi:hypothetical protein